MALTDGQLLGPYEILGVLGAGGMGEVYRARDTRLDREVAIKVLPERLARDEVALTRFEREAKAVAALSHPNILALHDVNTDGDGPAYAVMELLSGEALGAALQHGPLPPRKAVEIAGQVARGLGSAHDGGVVHRDIKPDNLFLTPDGRVKILDFGLAALAGSDDADTSANSATRTSLTQPGSVMGTINYMSPEQARGDTAGAAADIFSLGSVLYEMLTGHRPFERETAPETMTAILREDPPEIDRDGVSPSVARIVQRCLEKVPEQRFQSAHDLAFALEGTSQTSGTGVSAVIADSPPRAARRGWRVPALLALVAGVLIGGFGVSRLRPATIAAPVKIRPITFSGQDGGPAIAPDGRMIAFRSERGQTPGIWIKQLDRGDAVRLTSGTDGAPRFSPDGTTLLFGRVEGAAGGIYKVSTVGGEPRKVIDNALEGDWSPDGSRIVFIRSGAVLIANADGTDEQVVVDERQGEILRSPRWSPDGRTIAFVRRIGNNQVPLEIMLLDLDSGDLRALPPKRPSVSQLAWSGSGNELVYAWSEDLLAGAATSEASVVNHDIRTGEIRELYWARDMLDRQFGMELAVVAPGIVAFGTQALRQNLSWIDLDRGGASSPTMLTSGNSVDRQPRLSPDGETILFSSNRTGNLDLWTIHRTSGTVRQLTDDSASDWDPAFVNDGREIVWSSDRSGNLEIWIANADGSGARQVTQDGVDAENPSATPDGEWIVYMTANPAHPGLWKIRRDGSEATRLWEGAGYISELSPDGRHALFATAQGGVRILTVDIETSELLPFRIQVPTDIQRAAPAGNYGRARWTDGGRSIAFMGAVDNELGVFTQAFATSGDTSSTRRQLAGFDPVWVTESFEVSLDGSVVVLSSLRPGGTVMLAENVPYVTPPRAP